MGRDCDLNSCCCWVRDGDSENVADFAAAAAATVANADGGAAAAAVSEALAVVVAVVVAGRRFWKNWRPKLVVR